MRNIYYLFRTLYDVGFIRIYGRILYEIKKIVSKVITKNFKIFLFNLDKKTPKFKDILENFKNIKINSNEVLSPPNEIEFVFLNKKKLLNIPIKWNSKSDDQLWKFNLHYFDWFREFLEIKLKTGKWLYNSKTLNLIIDDWIDNNRLGVGDGWHSYTTSLRIRNWVLIFRICPDLRNQKRIDSLWLQVCWLYSNKEDYLGGNHWLENLISLIIGSLQFEGERPNEIFEFAFKELKNELNIQILKDGGHIERSAAYHLLILERLIELGFFLENINGARPTWLISSIRKMINWAHNVRLTNGTYPIFNDCPDIKNNIDSIINYGFSYINKKRYQRGIKSIFSEIYDYESQNDFQVQKKEKDNFLTKLLDTGWIIARDNNGCELIFKVGESCPRYLPAHSHSDLLSFDFYRNGKPIIVETGTSIYGKNNLRSYERSSAAHNVFQLYLYE